MSVNGVTSVSGSSYDAYQASQVSTKANDEAAKTVGAAEAAGVVYEPSNETPADTKSTAKVYTPNTDLVSKMKADAQARYEQMQNLVEQMLLGQGKAVNSYTSIWEALRNGDVEVDEATRTQAEEDISEDGYWGVKQTSDRIIDFANALTGGDPAKIEEMREAFKKGYEKAEKTWGGELPEISKKTYDAVMEKFDKMAEEAGLVTAN